MKRKSNNTKTLQVKLDPNLRQAFLKTALDNDQTGAQLLRAFMKEYVRKNGQSSFKLTP